MNCPIYKKCGGCQLQNLTYEEQLSLKQSKIIKLVGKYCHVDEIIGMEHPYNYRNKISRAFGFRNGRIISGIYQSASRRIVQTDSCFLEDEYADKVIKTIRELCISFRIKAYDINTGRGFFRHALIRRAKNSGETMAVLVTAKGDFPKKRDFVNALLQKHPELTTVVWNINPTETPLFLGEKSETLYGNGFITETLLGNSFRISPRSFYQVNTKQTEVLYTKVLELAELSGKERVIDAYCGTGTIGLTLARKAKSVIGVESNPDAVADAEANARLNGIKNAQFVAADAGEFMQSLAEKGEKIDTVITDPPRAGCSKRFIESLLSLSPKKIVYVSCNPETLTRDLFALRKGGYKVKKIQPIDMFPFTEHVETVVLLSREKADDYIRISVHTKDLQTKEN
ncbi:MAG: 23S rRNA (uracil(1939)-C(5))-methyltransferase RlmD [Clostridia bacterium]|nr:23S rRNA (uracil(1939)-C(5))-methyltransferase RlmD [Clostridia bacterium]